MDMMEKAMKQYGVMPLPSDTVEAMAYVPYQQNNPKTFNNVQGFAAGTMFPTLNKPFFGSKCMGDKYERA